MSDSKKRCTWEGCRAAATQPQIASTGEEWADLCDEHDRALKESVIPGKPGTLIAAWIRAQGGSAKAASRVLRPLG